MISIPGSLSLSFVMLSAPAKKSAGDVRCVFQDPSTHDKSHKISTQIRIRKRSSYVERKKLSYVFTFCKSAFQENSKPSQD